MSFAPYNHFLLHMILICKIFLQFYYRGIVAFIHLFWRGGMMTTGIQNYSGWSTLNIYINQMYEWFWKYLKWYIPLKLTQGSVLLVVSVLLSLVFGPVDFANLWKPVNRIRIITGKFGCTQIRSSSSCSSEKKKDFFKSVFLGSEYFAQRFNRPVDKKGKQNWPFFSPPRSRSDPPLLSNLLKTISPF